MGILNRPPFSKMRSFQQVSILTPVYFFFVTAPHLQVTPQATTTIKTRAAPRHSHPLITKAQPSRRAGSRQVRPWQPCRVPSGRPRVTGRRPLWGPRRAAARPARWRRRRRPTWSAPRCPGTWQHCNSSSSKPLTLSSPIIPRSPQPSWLFGGTCPRKSSQRLQRSIYKVSASKRKFVLLVWLIKGISTG